MECVKVMHYFVDKLQFDSLDFVAAMRLFLDYFRLPGEAQKIDRLVLKFSERFCYSNPDIFANAGL